jgi:hypothetical protein
MTPNVREQVVRFYCKVSRYLYEVAALALHSNDEEWMIVYKPLYDCPDAVLFTRPLREWKEEVEWPVGSGVFLYRFSKQ